MNNYWCIPSKDDADFVACMEDVLDVYELPYDPMYPVVCMDEKAYQLLDDVREPLSARPGSNLKTNSEYRRNGTCSIFAFVEPLGGRHHVSVHEHRTAIDWAVEIKLEIHYTPKHGSWLDMAFSNRRCTRKTDISVLGVIFPLVCALKNSIYKFENLCMPIVALIFFGGCIFITFVYLALLLRWKNVDMEATRHESNSPEGKL